MKGSTVLFTSEVRSVHAPENIKVDMSSFSKEGISLHKESENNQSAPKNTNNERSSLMISNAQPNDGGEYICRIMIRSTDEINVNHTVIVQRAGLSVQTVSFRFLVLELAFSSM